MESDKEKNMLGAWFNLGKETRSVMEEHKLRPSEVVKVYANGKETTFKEFIELADRISYATGYACDNPVRNNIYIVLRNAVMFWQEIAGLSSWTVVKYPKKAKKAVPLKASDLISELQFRNGRSVMVFDNQESGNVKE